jgi:hypothetical protein
MYEQTEVVEMVVEAQQAFDYWTVKYETAEMTRNERQQDYCALRLAEAKADLEAAEYVQTLVFGSEVM